MGSDDFYMILPSNVLPQNTASNYKVSWDTIRVFYQKSGVYGGIYTQVQ